MKSHTMTAIGKLLALALVMLGVLAPVPAQADRDGDKHERKEWRKKGHERGSDQWRSGRERDGGRRGHYFDDRQRIVIHDYYVEEFHGGRCPPGLAKKRNGCVPPGHAKRWSYGRPLPRDVIYYDLAPSVLVQLPPPRAGHRYVRVAGDILLIAIGTGLVLDAIEDLGRVDY